MRRLVASLALAGCAVEAPALRLSDATGAAATTVVEAQVEAIDAPLVGSPSLVGERATATLLVLSGEVPGRPAAKRVPLKFDSQGARRFVPGQRVKLRFAADGALAEVQ